MLSALAENRSGVVQRANGLALRYQVFGSEERAVFLLPTWSIVHTDFWRGQVRHLAERYTVLTFDGLGNGGSARSTHAADYSDDAFVDDAVKVMDAANIDRAAVVSVSMGAAWHLLLAYRCPERVAGSVYIATDLPLASLPPGYAEAQEWFEADLSNHTGWQMWNRRFWYEDWPSFCRFFFSRCFTEPDSEEEIAHFLSMGLETTPAVIAATVDADGISEAEARKAAAAIEVPTLVIHGTEDEISSIEVGRELARLVRAQLVELEGSGHEPQCRSPQQINALLDTFLARI